MARPDLQEHLLVIYRSLLAAYGPQDWWPGESALEVMVGAVLAQNTAWRNVERAIGNIKNAGLLSFSGLLCLPLQELEQLLRPAGTYRLKARRLRALVDYLGRAHGGDPAGLAGGEMEAVRAALLATPGIGPETADSILLYAAGRPTFVIDAYTRRLLERLGLAGERASYESLRALFMAHLPASTVLFNEYHALIVRHGKERCRRRRPLCPGCPLLSFCAWGNRARGPGGPLTAASGSSGASATGRRGLEHAGPAPGKTLGLR